MNQQRHIKITIVIPTYNRAGVIKRTLDSFLNQTFQDWECLVVDDHSTDNTQEVILEYCRKDGRFHYLLNERTKGAQGARNTGLYQAQGEWITFFDSDDYAFPEMLCTLFSMTSNDIDIVTSKANVVDFDSDKILYIADWCAASGNDVQKQLLTGETYISHNGCLIKKSKLLSIDGTDEKCPSHQELDLHIRLSGISTYAAANIVLSNYYVGAADTISVDMPKDMMGWIFIYRKYRILWRKKAYQNFIIRLGKLFAASKTISGRAKYRMQILLLAPEIVLYKVCQYIKCRIKK